MKKYRISKFYIGVYLAGMAFCFPGFVLGVIIWLRDHDGVDLIPLIIGLIGTAILIYQLLFDFQGGRFSFDEQGITMYIGGRSHFHAWASVADCGIVAVNVGDGNTYWVYLSRWVLTREERKAFLRKTRRDLDRIAFFQYNGEVLRELLPLMPSELAEKLRVRAHEIEPEMNWIERTYHR